MLKITILGLALAAFALSGAMVTAGAETIPTDEITCSDGRVLMLSPSDASMCVFKESVLKLEMRGFVFVGEPFDTFPIKSSNAQPGSSGIGQVSAPPVVSMSALPSANETAIVEITYTNQIGVNVTDAENFPIRDGYAIGWVVSSGFEVVDSDGVEPWTMYANRDEPPVTAYLELVPLDVGESKTYRIEVRAADEGAAYVAGLGYGFATARIHLYVDDEETLRYQEHLERYPEMHAAPGHETPAEHAELRYWQNVESIKAYMAGDDPWQDIGTVIDFIHTTDTHQDLALTDIKQILGDAGYADGEIEAEWSKRVYVLMWMNHPGGSTDAGGESAPFYAEYNKMVFMTYPQGGVLRDQLNGQEWQVTGSADPSNPDVQGLMDHVNLDLLYSGSQSLVSDLEVSYAIHLESFEDQMVDDFIMKRVCRVYTLADESCDYTSIDYTVILEGSVSNLATTDSQMELLERGWGRFIIHDEVVIDGVDVNRPISILESRLPETHELLAGTNADDVLLQHIIDVSYIRGQSMADWHFHLERSILESEPAPNLGYVPVEFNFYWTLGGLQSGNGWLEVHRHHEGVLLDRQYFIVNDPHRS